MPRYTFTVVDRATPISVYRVLAVSDNTNTFGYHQVVAVAADGRALTALWNMGRGEPKPRRGQPLTVTDRTVQGFHTLMGSPWSLEHIEATPYPATPKIIAAVWADPSPADEGKP
jgi:hypothetical protein